MFVLTLYDKQGNLKVRSEYVTHLSAYRSGENWKLIRKGNKFHISELKDTYPSQIKKLSNIEYDIHMDTLLGGFV